MPKVATTMYLEPALLKRSPKKTIPSGKANLETET